MNGMAPGQKLEVSSGSYYYMDTFLEPEFQVTCPDSPYLLRLISVAQDAFHNLQFFVCKCVYLVALCLPRLIDSKRIKEEEAHGVSSSLSHTAECPTHGQEWSHIRPGATATLPASCLTSHLNLKGTELKRPFMFHLKVISFLTSLCKGFKMITLSLEHLSLKSSNSTYRRTGLGEDKERGFGSLMEETKMRSHKSGIPGIPTLPSPHHLSLCSPLYLPGASEVLTSGDFQTLEGLPLPG